MTSSLEPPLSFLRWIQARLVIFLLAVSNVFLSLCALIFWPFPQPSNPQKILIFRIGNIGDTVCALPAMYAIRRAYPLARISLLTSSGMEGLPGAKDFLSEVNWIDEIISYSSKEIATFKGKLALINDLRVADYDLWINLSMELSTIGRELRDLVFTRLVGPKWARGWRINKILWGVQAQSQYLCFPNEVDRMNSVVTQLGFKAFPVEFGLPANEATWFQVDRILPPQFMQMGFVVIAPGCKRPANQWPTANFIRVGKFLNQHGLGVVLIGGPSDASECESIADRVGGLSISLASKISLPESIEVLRRSKLTVCVDSGIQHLSSAVGVPTLSLFSSVDITGKWFPYGAKNIVLQHWTPCNTCFLQECPFDNLCMSSIKVELVEMHLLSMLHLSESSIEI